MTWIFILMGCIFTALGTIVTLVFAGVSAEMTGVWFEPFLLIPMLFVVIGIGFLIAGIKMKIDRKQISVKGKRYSAKIYGYVEDTSFVVNGAFTINLKVHYFDEYGTEREAIIPTNFARNSNMYGIGMTIDIFEYRGKYDWDKDSIRTEVLPREDELMDNKPIAPEMQKIVAVRCSNCGVSFQAVKGYSNRCPYCNSYLNVK